MKKSELVARIAAESPGLTLADAEKVVRSVFDAISEELAVGGRVELRGFGAFSVRQRDSRKGRNPRTGELVDVTEKSVPFFKAGKELRDRLNAE